MWTAPTADPDADLEHALGEWRRYRRRRRIAGVHWVDALYQAYITALIAAVALYLLTGVVGDDRLAPAQIADVVRHGDDWLGVAVALALAVGLRSGCRGGPLALERAEVRHVLLAPVDRTTALRGPVVRQLRFFAFVAAVAGTEAGVLASRRIEHHAVVWAACGVVFTLATVALAYGAALCAAAWRLPSPAGTGLGILASAAALAGALDVIDASPCAWWGRIGLWPERFDAWGLAAVAVSLAVLGVGLLRVGDLSVESAERRSRLVGQLRFAATLQDLRTVLVLRRQLALELPRVRPWVRLPVRGTDRFPVWARGWRGVLRWPIARVGRLVLLGVGAGLALRGVWAGTTPLLAAAGAALFLAGLEAVEPLAQEVDHPSRLAAVPGRRGDVHARHLAVGVGVMAVTCLLGAAAAVLVEPSRAAVAVAAVCVVPAALGGVAGAVTSVLSGAPDTEDAGWSLVPPEVAGMRVLVRSVWPLVLAVGGTLPVLAARAAADGGGSPWAAAGNAAVGVVIGFAVVAWWVRRRDDLHAAWKAALDQAFPDKRPRSEEVAGG
ncbi:MAG TPA: hypothetical protein VIL48_23435 [Acidimicrobiales bacterium]